MLAIKVVNEEEDKPWFTDMASYVASGILSVELNKHQLKKFMHKSKFYQWDDSFLYRICHDKLIRRCVANAGAR